MDLSNITNQKQRKEDHPRDIADQIKDISEIQPHKDVKKIYNLKKKLLKKNKNDET